MRSQQGVRIGRHSFILSILLLGQTFFAQGQVNQHVQKITPPGGGRDIYRWQPDPNLPPQEPIDLDPIAVVLEYNCYYLRDICQNARDFFSSPRGQMIRNGEFYYDLNTKMKKLSRDPRTGQKWRSEQRRDYSCDGNWNKRPQNQCPASTGLLLPPARNDRIWSLRGLEPNTQVNGIANERDPNTGLITNLSYMRYTCDEFPPATWVEGGSGLLPLTINQYQGPSSTRCAAASCKGAGGAKGYKAEQDWQGYTHANLRRLLIKWAVKKDANGNPLFPNFNPVNRNDIIRFYFAMTNVPNNIPARVTVYDNSAGQRVDEKATSQAKRDLSSIEQTRDFVNKLQSMSLEERERLPRLEEVSTHYHLTEPGTVSPHTNPYRKDDDSMIRFLGNSTLSQDTHVNTDPFRHRGEVEYSGHFDIAKQVRAPAPLANISAARIVVNAAIARAAVFNEQRLARPLRTWPLSRKLSDSMQAGTARLGVPGILDLNGVTPLLGLSDEIVRAAAIIAEQDARAELRSKTIVRAAAGPFWMESIQRKGTVPWGNDPTYKVFRNVRDYGAKGDGITDDTQSIKKAMNDGKRCGEKCNGSTTKNAIVYFPAGTYLVSSSIPLPFGTQVIGNANTWPVVIASSSFVGLGVLSTDEYTGGGIGEDGGDQEWFVNTANFYRQIRNMKIDISKVNSTLRVACLHYQVAQATSVQNLELIASRNSGQIGIFAENGSGGQISDVLFRGGQYGIYGGSQQFTAQRLTFDGCSTAVRLIWDWSWTWKSIKVTNVNIGFDLLPESQGSNASTTTPQGRIGSASFIDSEFSSAVIGIRIRAVDPAQGSGSTGLVLENVKFTGGSFAVADTSSRVLLKSPAVIDNWVTGPVYSPGRQFTTGQAVKRYRRQSGLLDAAGRYFERAKPQYEDRPSSDFIHVKDWGVRGDGSSDDTSQFQQAIFASMGKILFVDAGSYIITNTLYIPSGARIVGEAWSQLVATGAYFGDAKNPKPLVQVGRKSEVGTVELQDLLFTSRGATPGLIAVQWNIRASSQGAAALWDCHVRLGGAVGTQLTPSECPPLTSGAWNNPCKAASLMMHVTDTASGYFENMWLWVADHMIDDPDLQNANNSMQQISVHGARGLLVESQQPTWLYGTSSEHSVMYQYNFNKARNVFAGMIQTESPYYQPGPPPPLPFSDAKGVISGDITYNCSTSQNYGCDASWAVIIRKSASIYIAGAGLYSWFQKYSQDCVDKLNCQKVLLWAEDNYSGVRIQNLVTIGAANSAIIDGVAINATANLNVFFHPRWAQISIVDIASHGFDYSQAVWIDPKIWNMDKPAITCTNDCVVMLPAWTKATRIVNVPLITLSAEAWTSTMTQPPLTLTNLIFDPVTLTAQSASKRSAHLMLRAINSDAFWPTPAAIPTWPNFLYTGSDGVRSTATPKETFPASPTNIAPGALAPDRGNWPPVPLKMVVDRGAMYESPVMDPCREGDVSLFCQTNGYFGSDIEEEPDDGPEPQFRPEEDLECPPASTTTTSTTSPTATPDNISWISALVQTLHCRKTGRSAPHVRMDSAIASFCSMMSDTLLPLSQQGPIPRGLFFHKDYDFPTSGEIPLSIGLTFETINECRWKFSLDDCARFMKVPVDSCNCGGIDGKQGGWMNNSCIKLDVDANNG